MGPCDANFDRLTITCNIGCFSSSFAERVQNGRRAGFHTGIHGPVWAVHSHSDQKGQGKKIQGQSYAHKALYPSI